MCSECIWSSYTWKTLGAKGFLLLQLHKHEAAQGPGPWVQAVERPSTSSWWFHACTHTTDLYSCWGKYRQKVLSLSAHTYSTLTNSMSSLTLHYATHPYTCRKESQTHRRWSKTRLTQNRGPSHSASPPSPFPFYFQLLLFTSLPWFLSFASLGASQHIHVDKYYSRGNLE